ncbi:MAG: hypothetical protein NVS4B11_16060 [Ktedonobacteraceae bacterium]
MDSKSANEALHQLGFNPQFVAAGMEGFVFDIGNAMLAKVWIKKDYAEVRQLHSFYTQLKENPSRINGGCEEKRKVIG